MIKWISVVVLVVSLAIPATAKVFVPGVLTIEFTGDVPSHASLSLSWYRIKQPGGTDCDKPCELGKVQINLDRASDGVASYDFNLPVGANYLCLSGFLGKERAKRTFLHMKNGISQQTHVGFEIDKNGIRACTHPTTNVKDALKWEINLEVR